MRIAEITKEIKDIVYKHGKAYKSAPLPEGVERHNMGMCFSGAGLEFTKAHYRNQTPKLYYCEGLAHCEGNKPMLHAWLTDGVHAYDVIWYGIDEYGNKVHVPDCMITYTGIPMSIDAFIKWLIGTGRDGILANRYRDKQLADRAIYSVIKR